MGHPYAVRGWGLLIASGTGLAAYMMGLAAGRAWWPSRSLCRLPCRLSHRPGNLAQRQAARTPGPTPSEISVAGTTTISQTSVSLVHDIALAIIAAGATLLPAGAPGYAAARRVPPTPQAPQAPRVPQAPEPPQTPPRKPPA